MKKLLALVLALVMVMGLATVGTSAAVKFSDAADINYKEAVDVLSTLGVLGGDENGFRPKDQLKRSEGAKIIAYLMLQPAAAEQMTGGGKFTDVPATHWAAGYIEYLAVEGVIGGIGDNRFDPDGPLTTAAFAKMLLGALGYDAVIEGMGGPDWMINVQRLAKKVGLFDSNPNAVVSSNITREEAALYAFNMICSPLVEYENKGSSLSVNGATIDFGASKATYRVNTGKKESRYRQIDTITTNYNSTESYIIEFAEEYFEKLVLNERAGKNNNWDDFGRPCNKWVYDGKKIGTYNIKEDLLYTTTVTLGQIYKDLGLTKATAVVDFDDLLLSTFRVDGEVMPIITIEKESNTKIGGNGCETYVYYDEGEVRISCVNWYVGDVTGVYAATSSKNAYIYIAGRSGDHDNIVVVSGEKDVTGYNVDDVVRYTAHTNMLGTADYKIDDVEKAEVVKGKLDGYVMYGSEGLLNSATGDVKLAGKTYTYSAKVAGTPDGTFIKNNVELDVVLDKYGYALDVSDYGVQNFAVVVNTKANAGTFLSDNVVDLVFTDGTKTGAVYLNGDDHGKDEAAGLPTYGKAAGAETVQIGDIVTYSIGSNGKYSLTLMRHAWTTSYTNYPSLVVNGSSGLNLRENQSDDAAANPNAVRANGKTIFVIKDKSGNYKVYEGIKNVPTITGGRDDIRVNAFAKTYANNKQTGSAAAIVYIDLKDTDAWVYNNETVFVHYDSAHNRKVNAGNDPYYEFEAIVNGEKQTLKIDDKTYKNALALYGKDTFNGDFYVLYNSITKNSSDVATLDIVSQVNTYTRGLKNKTVGLGVNGVKASYSDKDIEWFSLADNCKVFYINENNEIQASSAGSIPDYDKTGQRIYVWYSFDNTGSDLNYIFWTKQAQAQAVRADTWAGLPVTDSIVEIEANLAEAFVNGFFAETNIENGLKYYDITYITDVAMNRGFTLPGGLSVASDASLVIEGDLNITADNYGLGNPFKVEGNLVVEGTLTVDGYMDIYGLGYVRAESIVITKNGHVELGDANEKNEAPEIMIYGDDLSTIGGANSFIQNYGTSSFGDTLITGRFEIYSGTAMFDALELMSVSSNPILVVNNTKSTGEDVTTVTVLGDVTVGTGSNVTVTDADMTTGGDTTLEKNSVLKIDGDGCYAFDGYITGNGAIDVTEANNADALDGDVNAISDGVKKASTGDDYQIAVSVTISLDATKLEGLKAETSGEYDGFVLWKNLNSKLKSVINSDDSTVDLVSVEDGGPTYTASISGIAMGNSENETYVVDGDTVILTITITDGRAAAMVYGEDSELSIDPDTIAAIDEGAVTYISGDTEMTVEIDAMSVLEAAEVANEAEEE